MECCSKTPLHNWKAPEPDVPYLTGLKVCNSLSGTKVPFVPNEGNVVNWYGCGPTVYDSAHMGHARNYVTFDIMRRIMEDYFGYKVNMCMNITDIDDKIIARANESQIPFEQLARFWENDFFLEMRKLKCKLPDVITRVSEYVPEIIKFIEDIIKNGYGYESQGSVYFDTAAFRANEKHVYGRMEPWSINDEARVLEGEGALGVVATEKRTPLDFALWKKAKPGEPSWASPWGEGRPGWHIECSAMASDVLGFPLDLHSGGIDLRFPHHDNELAQTEACFDRPRWVNYFLHSGHLHIKGLKMSKSLKNFITIKHILSEYNPRVVRILALIHRWDQPMNYDPEGGSMKEPSEIDRTFTHYFENMTSLLRKLLKSNRDWTDPKESATLDGLNAPQKWRDVEKNLQKQYEETQTIIHNAFCDNFNTPLVMTKIQELIGSVNLYVRNTPENELRGPLLAKIATYIYGLLKIVGLTSDEDGALNYAVTTSAGSEETEKFSTLMDSVGGFRNEMRELSRQLLKPDADVKSIASKLLSLSDRFRDEDLIEVGVRLEDKGEKGFVWKQSNKAELLKEKQRKLEEEASQKAAKEKRLAELAEAKARKEKESQIPPCDYFRLLRAEEFSEFDDDGIPTKLADGQLVSKGQREKMRKALEKHRAVYERTANATN